MEKINGVIVPSTVAVDQLKEHADGVVSVDGFIHRIREMTGFSFVILRTMRDEVQCVYSPEFSDFRWRDDIVEGCTVRVTGKVVGSKDRAGNDRFEIQIHDLKVLSSPAEQMPIVINKKQLDNVPLDTNLNYRPITLRNPRERAIFKIQEGIARGFREFLQKNDFTEIRTPKINFAGAEGGANIFKLDYFGKQVFLAQSPQFYKQAMVPVYERVFEIGPVFRAEKHNTQRHLNEYTSMDFEMGFIDGFEDVMQMETKVLQNIMAVLKADYAPQLAALHVALPDVTRIPAVRFDEAKRMVSEKYGRAIRDPFDLEPEEEQLISRLFAEEYGSEFVFVTHYPSKKRPFYAADDPEDPRYTLSFDLLFRGLEVTTGGQRIHDYDTQVAKMLKKGMNPEDFAGYLMIHKYGTCPHGGLGLGLERLTARLLGENNVRETCLFPRDQQRIEP